MPFSSGIHPPRISDERVLFLRVQRAEYLSLPSAYVPFRGFCPRKRMKHSKGPEKRGELTIRHENPSPLLVPYDPWSFDLTTTPNTGPTPSRDHSPDSGDLSMTNSVRSASFPAEYRTESSMK
ncbi:hypothetical protein BDM02DRAFT_3123586 [Thelephora ganbajun]|uniref:Uncharacterized protein n=1 Tax=Thelephora ganbajun TaxID=370292 RepID=A0ACB6Z1S0_THEGA|nr:hypothetical protein BDM02DRAFT_3123586 [Thelephora ganbajun]